MGLPVFLNPSLANISLLGADYPLFCNQTSDILPKIMWLSTTPSAYMEVSKKCLAAVSDYTVSRAYDKLLMVLE
jgi:hypothetical protein